MNLLTQGKALTVAGGVKLLLSTTGPLQNFFDPPSTTHEFCNRQALAILRRDGFSSCAGLVQRYLKEINAGVYWADEGWKNVGHFFQIGADKGLWRFPTAIDEFRCYYSQALYKARRGDAAKSAFYLGAAAHLLQDLCVPHHARVKLLAGHQQYESWAQSHCREYAVDGGGIYHEDRCTHGLLHQNAKVAADLIDWVGADAGVVSYHNATTILLPLAQRTTAGLFLQYFTAAGAVICAA